MRDSTQNAMQLIKIFAPIGLFGCPIFIVLLIIKYLREHDPIALPVIFGFFVGWVFNYWVCRKYLGWGHK